LGGITRDCLSICCDLLDGGIDARGELRSLADGFGLFLSALGNTIDGTAYLLHGA